MGINNTYTHTHTHFLKVINIHFLKNVAIYKSNYLLCLNEKNLDLGKYVDSTPTKEIFIIFSILFLSMK